MITRINPRELKRALSHVLPVVPSRSVVEETQYVLIDARERGRLEVTGTDMETTVTASIAAHVDAPGRVCVLAKLLAGIVGLLDEYDEVVLRYDSTFSLVSPRGDGTTYELASLPADSFPARQEPPAWRVELGKVTIDHILQAVLPMAAQEHYRPALTGVSFRYQDGKLRIAATDGYRLGMVCVPAALTCEEGESECLVPAHVVKLLRGVDVSVLMGWDSSHVAFSSGDVTIVSRVFAGVEFPTYESILHTGGAGALTLTLPRQKLIDALRRVSLFADDGVVKPVVMTFSPGHGIFLQAEQHGLGNRAREFIGSWSGQEFRIGFNVRYVLDALRAIDEETVSIELSGANKPAFFRRQSERDLDLFSSGILVAVMPLNLSVIGVSLPPGDEREQLPQGVPG